MTGMRSWMIGVKEIAAVAMIVHDCTTSPLKPPPVSDGEKVETSALEYED